MKVRVGDETFYVSKTTHSLLISICGFAEVGLVYLTVRPLTFSPVRFSKWVFPSLKSVNKVNDFFIESLSCDVRLYPYVNLSSFGFCPVPGW